MGRRANDTGTSEARLIGLRRASLVSGTAVMVLGAAMLGVEVMAQAPAPSAGSVRSAREGVYNAAQAARGQAVYAAQCASCHGEKLEGVSGPPLSTNAFLSRWQGQTLGALAAKVQKTMPAGDAGRLTPQQAADLVAHVLRGNGLPAGAGELAADDTALARVGLPAGMVATAAAVGTVRAFPPLGNMAQLMRGVFFPNSNLIFTVQTADPAAPAPKVESATQTGGFSWVNWGAGIYGGWELVDNAAIALADASPLMLTPGIRCENGRLAPVTEPDWIKYTEQMIAVARRTYQASQSRSQDAVSEATGDLSDACFNCHQAYRDVRRPGARALDPTDPAAKATRCMPRASR
jgi:mono/diheme cytochrome c family protein